jgi:hypothetical protein
MRRNAYKRRVENVSITFLLLTLSIRTVRIEYTGIANKTVSVIMSNADTTIQRESWITKLDGLQMGTVQ